jgi:uncharacterized membrane protein YgdD (TMEM256/DUF423 family)
MIAVMFPRIALLLSGFIGALGVALSAAVAHGGDQHLLGTAATMCLAHAPVLLGIFAAFDRIRTASVATLLIGVGCLLFTSDLLWRTHSGTGLFPMSAPTGGTMMILGWVALGIGGFFSVKPR